MQCYTYMYMSHAVLYTHVYTCHMQCYTYMYMSHAVLYTHVYTCHMQCYTLMCIHVTCSAIHSVYHILVPSTKMLARPQINASSPNISILLLSLLGPTDVGNMQHPDLFQKFFNQPY